MDPSIGRGLNQKCLQISSVFPDFCIHGTSCYNVHQCSNMFLNLKTTFSKLRWFSHGLKVVRCCQEAVALGLAPEPSEPSEPSKSEPKSEPKPEPAPSRRLDLVILVPPGGRG